MILVTVGTTIPFDELFEEVDRLAGAGAFGDERVLCQVGQSAYRMRHCEFFAGRPTMRDLMAEAAFVVCHGGAATVIELLQGRKPFVAFPNPRAAGDHQAKFLERCAQVAPISWSRDVRDLERLMAERRGTAPAAVRSDLPRLSALMLAEVRGLRG